MRCAGAFELQTLILDNNQLHSAQEIRALSLLDKLATLTLAGNPIIARLGPRAVDVLARNSCPSLQTLDGRTLAAGRRNMPVLEASKEGTGRVFADGSSHACLPVPLWTEVAERDLAQGAGTEAASPHVTLRPMGQVQCHPKICATCMFLSFDDPREADATYREHMAKDRITPMPILYGSVHGFSLQQL